MSEQNKQSESSKIEDNKMEQVNGGKQIKFDRSTTRKCSRCGMTYPIGTTHVCAKR